MCSRIIAAYLALCPGDINIIDMLIKADTVIDCIRDNPSIDNIGFRILIKACISKMLERKHTA